MKRFFALITIAALFGCNPPKGPTAKEILNNVAINYNNHKSVAYHVNYSLKLYDKDEPYNYAANCQLVRDAKDPLFNGAVYLSYPEKSGMELFYNTDKIYSINDSSKTITVYNDPKSQSWAITGSMGSGVSDIYFLKPSEITDITNDTSNKETLDLAKIGYVDYWKVTVKFPDDKAFSERTKEFWVDRKDTTLKKITAHVKFQGKDECKEWDIDSITFDKTTPESLNKLVVDKFHSCKMTSYGSDSLTNQGSNK